MGIDSILQQNMQNAGLAGIDRLAGNAMFPQSQMDKTQYATPSQMPTSAEVVNAGYEPQTNPYTGAPTANFASGGLASIPRFYDGGSPASEGKVYVGDENSGQWVSETPNIENDPRYTNPDFQHINLDLEQANALNALKETDPAQYNAQLMSGLSNSLKFLYNSNQNYEPTWKQFQSLQETDPAQWHKQQLDWLGHQQGWQIGQNTSERNDAGMPVIQDEIEQAKKAGISEEEINNILSGSQQAGNIQNQQRIITEQQAGHGPLGMTTSDYVTIAAILASGAGAAYLAPAAGAAGATEAGALMGPTYGELGITGLAEGAMGPTYAEMGYTGLNQGQAIAAADAAASTAKGIEGAKDAYDVYKNVNRAKNLLNSLSNAGGETTASGNQGINNPYAMSAGFNPGVRAPSVGIADTSAAKPWTNLAPNITLSKLSEFAPDYSRDMAAGGIAQAMAAGGIGHLGSYSDGGRLLKGPGDGMSDHIPATIGDKQPARLAEGEFVVPADVVSHLGNGSTDAGAKQLYKMMNNIRKARTGNPKQGKQINPDKFTPKG